MKRPQEISKTFMTDKSLYKQLQDYLRQKATEINDDHSDYSASLTSTLYDVVVTAPAYPESIRNDLQFIVVKKLSNRAKPSYSKYFKILISQKLLFKKDYRHTIHLKAHMFSYGFRKQTLVEADLNLYNDLVADISDFIELNGGVSDTKH